MPKNTINDEFDFTYTMSAQSVQRFARTTSAEKPLDEVAEDLDDLIIQAGHNQKIFRVHDAKAGADDTRIAFVSTLELQGYPRVMSLVVVLRPLRGRVQEGDYGPGDSGMLALVSLPISSARESLSDGTWIPYLATDIDQIKQTVEEFDRLGAQSVDPRLAALKTRGTRAEPITSAVAYCAADACEAGESCGWGSRAERAKFVVDYYAANPDASMAAVSEAAREKFGAGIREKTIKKYLGDALVPRLIAPGVLTADKFASSAGPAALGEYTARLVDANRAVARARAALRDAETALVALQDEAA